MKLAPCHRRHRQTANVLLGCLFVAAVVGLILVNYLRLGGTNELLVSRSQVWNLALPVAEAGVEEALTQLNYSRGKKDLESNGWVSGKKGHNTFRRTRTLAADAYYDVTIDTKKPVTITSTGYLRAPLSSNYISRTVVVNADLTNIVFTKSMVAKKHIRCGRGTLIDSFDSTDPAYSTAGDYDPLKRKDTATVAATSTSKNAIRIDRTKVYGSAAVAPKGGVEFKNNGSLGDLPWVDSGSIGAQPKKVNEGFTQDFPPVRAPWSGAVSPPPAGIHKGEPVQYLLGAGNYQLGAVSLTRPMVITGKATLYVTGDFKAASDIIIEPGGSLTLYMAGGKFELKDKDVIANDNDATQFQYFGLASNKEIRIAKKGILSAVIYAPRAKVKIEGEGDLIGSVVGKCIHMKQSGAFHFDEGINKRGTAVDFYSVVAWLEY